MKFIIATQELSYLLSKILNVVSPKATIPILANILIEAQGNEICLSATDLTVGVRCKTEAKVLKEGATTLPAKRFSQLIKELKSVNVEISTNENDVTEILSDSSRFKLFGMNKSEFPQLPDLGNAKKISIQEKDLKEMLYRTSFAVSREDNRYVLTGVCLNVENGRATFVGTDGKRLSRTFLSLPADLSFKGSYIIPLKAVEEIQKCLKDEGEASLYLMEDKIAVHSEDTMIVSKLLSGEYPDVDRVIPENPETVVTLDREELMTLLRQVSLFTADTSHSVRFSFTKGELKLTANTMDIGEGLVKMPVNYHGAKLEIAFNPNYFMDILRHNKSHLVTMGITDSFNPGVIKELMEAQEKPEKKEESAVFVLMPMRLGEE
ncbi:DNA polymerase III subunit beta [Criblamydia sequanensis]|uniref:Beta sliding clamp n=1 Tax=Candidatus Criblamydia sequanensis CRIB-18 TaxID=1437425 RepID=A0A090D0V5_9BACT|nr:DNA polymerase III subunit beta [Criblamydia sequanensis]CDR34981.1 DNA polymerase III, beta subunit [Criblamydia sequanensis CRIB-18]